MQDGAHGVSECRDASAKMHLSYGAAMVSTGILRHDKRGGQDNPVKMSNLNNKRQQYCCSCSVSCDAAL